MNTVVLQSQSPQRIPSWQARCLESVQQWAEYIGADYRFIGDELFDYLPPALRPIAEQQPVVATDVARLGWLTAMLQAGYGRAIWCDADLLIFRQFLPAESRHAFGREAWVQRGDRGVLRCYRKVHNAWMLFCAGDPVLPFYFDRAVALLERAQLPVVPQFVGPKLLTALHNLVHFVVEERVGMLSPLAMADLLAGGGPALDQLLAAHREGLAGVNLCASYQGRETDGVCHGDAAYDAAAQRLIRHGMPGV